MNMAMMNIFNILQIPSIRRLDNPPVSSSPFSGFTSGAPQFTYSAPLPPHTHTCGPSTCVNRPSIEF